MYSRGDGEFQLLVLSITDKRYEQIFNYLVEQNGRLREKEKIMQEPNPRTKTLNFLVYFYTAKVSDSKTANDHPA